MYTPEAISLEQTLEILDGPREIAHEITAQVEERLDKNLPVVDTDAFSAAMAQLSADKTGRPPANLGHSFSDPPIRRHL